MLKSCPECELPVSDKAVSCPHCGYPLVSTTRRKPRKTFVTLAKKYNLDEYAIKRIVGHNVSDITEAVYTERDAKWLADEMAKIKKP